MFDWKKWVKILWIIPPVFLSSMDSLAFGRSNVAIGDDLVGKIFEQISVDNQLVFILMAEKLIYLVIFNILFGNAISEEFRHNSVYLFSRLKNRKEWFYKKVLELCGLAAGYTLIFVGTNVLICVLGSTQKIGKETIVIFLLLWCTITMVLTITTLAINLISLKYGNSIGFIVVYSTMLVLIYVAIRSQQMEILRKHPLLISLNPATGVSFDVTKNSYMQLAIWIYYGVIIGGLSYFGGKYINKFDIAVDDGENN